MCWKIEIPRACVTADKFAILGTFDVATAENLGSRLLETLAATPVPLEDPLSASPAVSRNCSAATNSCATTNASARRTMSGNG